MYANAQRMRWEPIRSIAFGSISGTYAAIGTALPNPSRLIRIINTTNADVLISTDGTTNNDIIPAGGFVLYDIMSNKSDSAGLFVLDQGSRIYVKQASGAPTSGNVYLVSIYASSF